MTLGALAAQRRLGVVSAHLNGGGGNAKLVVVLPDGGKITVIDVPSTLDSQSTPIQAGTSPTMDRRRILSLNGAQIASFVILQERKVAFDAVALGTRYQGVTKHIPKYNVVKIESFVDEGDYGKVWAWVYGLVMLHHEQEHIPILFERGSTVPLYLLESGIGKVYPTFGVSKRILESVEDLVFLSRSAFWQGAGTTGWHGSGWILDPRREPFPAQRAYTRNDRVIAAHPLRPPKPKQGTTLYRRWCGSVKRTLEITYFDLGDGNIQTSRHMAAFHKWHNDERVNSAWGERGSLETHREYVETVLEDPNVWPCMLSWDGELMGYVEIVWAKENHVGQHYPNGVVVGDWERGIHVLAGESKFVGSGMSETWIRSLVHYIYLADPRTERVIGEPDCTNKAILAVAKNSGFHTQTFFDFPYKKSAMVLNVRDSFFTQCRLY